MRHTALLLFASLTLVPVAGRCDPPRRAEVVAALSGFERAPNIAEVRAWGLTGRDLLIEVARDPVGFVHVRTRAVHALRAFAGDPTAQRFLRDTAALPAQELFMLRAALDALVEGFGDVATVAAYLRDARVEVRDGAAWSLAASRDPAARAALTAHLRVESDPTVRDTITRALAPTAPAAPVVTAPVLPPSSSVALTPRSRRARRR